MAGRGGDTARRLGIAEELARLAGSLEVLRASDLANWDGPSDASGVEDVQRLAAAVASARCAYHACTARVHDLLAIVSWACRSRPASDPVGGACWLASRSQSPFFARATLRDAEGLGLLRPGDAVRLIEAYRIVIRPQDMSWQDWINALGTAAEFLGKVVECVEASVRDGDDASR